MQSGEASVALGAHVCAVTNNGLQDVDGPLLGGPVERRVVAVALDVGVGVGGKQKKTNIHDGQAVSTRCPDQRRLAVLIKSVPVRTPLQGGGDYPGHIPGKRQGAEKM